MDSLSAVGAPPLPPSLKLSDLPNDCLYGIVQHLPISATRNLGYALPKKTGALAQWAFEDFATGEIGLGGTADERVQQTRALVAQLREWIEKRWIPKPFLRWKPPTRIGVSEIDVWATLKALEDLEPTVKTVILGKIYFHNPVARLLEKERWEATSNFFSPLWQYLLKHWFRTVVKRTSPRCTDQLLADHLLQEALKTKNQPLFQIVTNAFRYYSVNYDIVKKMIPLNWRLFPPRTYKTYSSGMWHYHHNYYVPKKQELVVDLLNEALRINASKTTAWLISSVIGPCDYTALFYVSVFFTKDQPVENNPFFEACRLGRTKACALLWESLQPYLQTATPEDKQKILETLTHGRRIAEENGHGDIVAFLTQALCNGGRNGAGPHYYRAGAPATPNRRPAQGRRKPRPRLPKPDVSPHHHRRR